MLMARFSYSDNGAVGFDPTAMDGTEPAGLPCDNKLIFDSERLARAAATVAEYQHGASLRPYMCKHCGLWHLSSNL